MLDHCWWCRAGAVAAVSLVSLILGAQTTVAANKANLAIHFGLAFANLPRGVDVPAPFFLAGLAEGVGPREPGRCRAIAEAIGRHQNGEDGKKHSTHTRALTQKRFKRTSYSPQ